MNQQNMSKTPSSTMPDLPVKRKRGRPRKDESMSRKEKRQTTTTASISPSQPLPMSAMTTIQPPPTATIGDNHNMVGQVVTGVIDGVFDAGYLLSVRVGPNNSLLRGLVFQQGQFCPVTRANDVAPHLKMCRRENFQIPISNQTQLCTSQAACAKQPSPPQIPIPVPMHNYQTSPMIPGGSSNCAPPPETLRMVEQDELMQVFEVTKIVEEPTKNYDFDHGFKNDHLVSNSDLMAESLPQNLDHESAVKESDKIEQQEGENPEPITHSEFGVEEPSSLRKDMLQEENQKPEGEMCKIDVNQDPNQGVSTDLFQTNQVVE